MGDWEDVRTDSKNEGDKDFSCEHAAQKYEYHSFSFIMASTSFKIRVAFNIFNRSLKEKSELRRDKMKRVSLDSVSQCSAPCMLGNGVRNNFT